MSAVGQPEIHTRRRVIAFFQEALGYAYPGNWRDRPDNRNIQLGNRLPALLATWQHKAGVSVHDMRIKKMKTRWGSCNVTARRIWLNLELAKNRRPAWNTSWCMSSSTCLSPATPLAFTT